MFWLHSLHPGIINIPLPASTGLLSPALLEPKRDRSQCSRPSSPWLRRCSWKRARGLLPQRLGKVGPLNNHLSFSSPSRFPTISLLHCLSPFLAAAGSVWDGLWVPSPEHAQHHGHGGHQRALAAPTPSGRCYPAPSTPKPRLCSWLTSQLSGPAKGEESRSQRRPPSLERNANPQLRTPVPTISGSLTVVPSEKGGKGETPTRLQGALSDLRGEGPQPQSGAGGQPEDILSVGLQAFHRE